MFFEDVLVRNQANKYLVNKAFSIVFRMGEWAGSRTVGGVKIVDRYSLDV